MLEKHVGGYDNEEKAARAYDLAALKYWGPTTTTNFPVRWWTSPVNLVSTFAIMNVPTHPWRCWLLMTIRVPMVGVQVREGAGGDEVDDAAGVHRVAAQVSE
jgi:hypothetical protein